MDLTIDAMGDKCPIPVVKAKKALKTVDEGTVTMLVDNETSVHNLESLAESLKCASSVEKKSDEEFVVAITKDANSASGDAPAANDGTRVVVISSQYMGGGDDTLGGNLMKAFIFSLTQMDNLPDTVLFYNGGAHLTCEGSPALEDIQALANAGVEILTCGTCLKFYGLEEKLAVGEVTNMYVIAEKQLNAGVVVRP